MIRSIRWIRKSSCLSVVVLGACSGAAPQRTETPPVPQTVARVLADSSHLAALIAEGTQRSHVEQDFRYLTDVIGPRLTGTPAMRRANDWVAQKLLDVNAGRGVI